MRILQVFRRLKKSLFSYTPVIEIHISKENILHNLSEYREGAGIDIAPVIKSNAYGHGLALVANILEKAQVPFLIVDSLFEANLLLSEGIKTPILVIGFTPTENIRSAARSIIFTVGTLLQLGELTKKAPATKIHLKIDTGMHRQGIMPEDVGAAIKILKNSNMRLEGICSHLADAETESSPLTEKQISVWNSVAGMFKTTFPRIRYFHLSASGGVAHGARIDANVLRLGIGLYGIQSPPNKTLNLRPALEMRSQISALRTLEPGEKIGYSGTFETQKKTVVATVPVGYYEGLDRRLSNKGVLRVRGIATPILGRVSMNISSIDVSTIPDVQVGEPVEIISMDKESSNSIENIAVLCGTIPYEILVHIPAHLFRKIV